MPSVQVLVLHGPGSGQSDDVMQATHLPVASHLPSEHEVLTGLTPGTHALLRQADVEHSPPVGVHSISIMPWPSALHVMSVLPLQDFAPGMQTLQVLSVWLHPASPHGCSSAKSEPSSLQVLSVVPSELHVLELGMHCMSRHAPASSLHSATDAHSIAGTYWPSSLH